MSKIIVALIGKAGAGKDTVAKELATANPHWNTIISCTTRPKREGEEEGVNYYYLTDEEFQSKMEQGDLLEATCFNGWHYGTLKSSLHEGVNVGVFNPEGFDSLIPFEKKKEIILFGYFINASDKIRMMRQLCREIDPDVAEICRRYFADEDDFEMIDAMHEHYIYGYFDDEFLNENVDDLNIAVKKISNNVNAALDVGHKP